ncbi:MAG: Stk1 family PASTA domain-containing Ser/Thr kinase [Clostridia bacterium]
MENYVGKRLDGRYEIMEIIGIGGMAVVYKAFDNIDSRIVAVKILKDEFLANEDFKRRFKNESKAISVLSHENIVRVFDVSYGDRIQYIVMEYIEGITLKEYIEQQGMIDQREAIYFVTQILRALEHAHEKGIVHRDIKPQNILLISDGSIKVTDFGIARFSASETRTMTDGAIGSVHYISPEQATGSVTDAKADIYSVGVVFYEMLTGCLPFQSDSVVSVALMQLQNDPQRPSELNPDIPLGLEQIIIHAMQKNPSERYQSAAQILSDIDEFKANPEIKFDYSYYNDENVNQFIPITGQINVQPISKEPEVVAVIEDEDAFNTEAEIIDNSKKKTIAALFGVLIAFIVAVVLIVSFMFPSGDKVAVPDLVGLNFFADVDGYEAYDDFEFEFVIDTQSTEDEGTILAQSPESGNVEVGSTIILNIAKSSGSVEVPDVVGYEYASAESLLKSESFEVTIIREVSDTVDIGSVIRTDPAAGDFVDFGSTITLYVCAEEEDDLVDVPTLIGMTVTEAKAALEEVGLALDNTGTEYRTSDEATGTIVGHESIGEQVALGTAIAVYVSIGGEVTTETPTVSVPDISNKTESAAQTALEDVGLELGTVTEQYSSSVDSGKIISYSNSGSEVEVGTAINIVISKGEEPTTTTTEKATTTTEKATTTTEKATTTTTEEATTTTTEEATTTTEEATTTTEAETEAVDATSSDDDTVDE